MSEFMFYAGVPTSEVLPRYPRGIPSIGSVANRVACSRGSAVATSALEPFNTSRHEETTKHYSNWLSYVIARHYPTAKTERPA